MVAGKSVLRWNTLVIVVLFGLTGLAACITKHQAGAVSLATLTVNGPGLDGVVFTKASQYYTLSGINANQQYTLRTMISTTVYSDATGSTFYVPDGKLTITVYSSESAYKNNEPPEFTIDSGFMTSVSSDLTFSYSSYVYEKNFIAASSGDYVAVINGESLTIPGEQFFYDFRVMSGDALVTLSTPTLPISDVQTLSSGYMNIYDLQLTYAANKPGGYSITLTSDASSTSDNPQMFLYADGTLTTDKLLLSSIPTTTYYLVYQFQNGSVVGRSYLSINSVRSEMWTLPSASAPAPAPFVVIKGIASSASYTLDIGF